MKVEAGKGLWKRYGEELKGTSKCKPNISGQALGIRGFQPEVLMSFPTEALKLCTWLGCWAWWMRGNGSQSYRQCLKSPVEEAHQYPLLGASDSPCILQPSQSWVSTIQQGLYDQMIVYPENAGWVRPRTVWCWSQESADHQFHLHCDTSLKLSSARRARDDRTGAVGL